MGHPRRHRRALVLHVAHLGRELVDIVRQLALRGLIVNQPEAAGEVGHLAPVSGNPRVQVGKCLAVQTRTTRLPARHLLLDQLRAVQEIGDLRPHQMVELMRLDRVGATAMRADD